MCAKRQAIEGFAFLWDNTERNYFTAMLPWNSEDLTFDETRFSGTARLFPLPDLVLFPHVMQPFHVFESRHRDLLNAALDHDGLIAMSLLAPGWESGYEGCPPLLPHACLGRVITHQRREDGQYDVLLLGMRRIKIIEELSPRNTFREAKVQLLDDLCDSENDSGRESLQTALMQSFQENLPGGESASAAVRELLSTDIPLSVLTDLVSFALPLPIELKTQLLAECDVDRRGWLLLEALETDADSACPKLSKPQGNYSPPFSSN